MYEGIISALNVTLPLEFQNSFRGKGIRDLKGFAAVNGLDKSANEKIIE